MALSASLNTNEVKDRTGTEVEFVRIGGDGRSTKWAQKDESPHLPHRITLSHQESGVNAARKRRSVLRIDKVEPGSAISTPRQTSAYIVLEIPVGDITTVDLAKDCLAELTSLVATLATNTLLYDGTGNGAVALLNGSVV